MEPPPAPTTSALPKKKEKQIRRKPEAAAVEAERDAEEPLQLGRRRKRDWEEDEGGRRCLGTLVCSLPAADGSSTTK